MKKTMKMWYSFLGVKKDLYGKYITLSLLVIFFVGVFNIFARAPFTWFDEQAHYAKSIAYSHFHVSRTSGKISETEEMFVERALGEITDTSRHSDDIISLNWARLYTDLDYSPQVKVSGIASGAGIYTPVVYSPHILANWLARLFGLNVVSEFLLMRIFGFIAAFSLLILAIKLAPIGKFALAGLAMLPTLNISMTAISADTISNGVLFIFLASVMRLYVALSQHIAISRKTWLGFIGLSCIVVMCKIPVFVVLGLYLPLCYVGYREKQMSKKLQIVLYTVLALCAVFTVVWALKVTQANTFASATVDAKRQLAFILADIPRFLDIMVTNILGYNILSIQLGYVETVSYLNMPIVLSLLYFCGLTYACTIEDDNGLILPSNWYTTIIYIFKVLMFVFVVVFSFYTMYTQFSQIGSNVVEGVQPRYMYPFFALLFPVTKLSSGNINKIGMTWGLLLLPTIYSVVVTLLQL